MKFKQPSPEQLELWQEWLNHPDRAAVREVASRFDPWTLYRMKSTGQRVYLLAFSDPGEDGKVTCRVGVSGEFNLVTHERDVFGVDPDDLEECDLPDPDELLGTMEIPVETIKSIMIKNPDGITKGMLAELMLQYPLQKRGGDS